MTVGLLLILVALVSHVCPAVAEAATGQLSLAWSDPTPSDHDGFKVIRKTGTTGTYAQVATVGATTFAYTDPGLTPGSTYCYEILAYNAGGDSSPSNEACAPVAMVTYPLTVSVTGTGTVTSSPAGITCTTNCSVSFNADTKVTLNATPGSSFTFSGWGGACGTGACTVTMTAAQNVTATFVASPPTVSSAAPSSGSTAGGTAVTITGSNFLAGATVTLGGAAATGVTVSNSTSLRATTPAHAAGAVSIVVTNPGGQSGTLANGFTYTAPQPTVSSAAPSSGSTAGGTAVTITGSNFLAGATVTLGGAAATGVTVANSTSLTATTPANAAGAVNIVVTNPGGQSGTLANGFTYTAPPPGTAYTLSVTVSGTGGGTVTSSPNGINCGSACSASFSSGMVTLTATSAGGSTFSGWRGACIGTGTCTLLMGSDQQVSASFASRSGRPKKK